MCVDSYTISMTYMCMYVCIYIYIYSYSVTVRHVYHVSMPQCRWLALSRLRILLRFPLELIIKKYSIVDMCRIAIHWDRQRRHRMYSECLIHGTVHLTNHHNKTNVAIVTGRETDRQSISTQQVCFIFLIVFLNFATSVSIHLTYYYYINKHSRGERVVTTRVHGIRR